MDEAELTIFQIEVAHTFFRLNASEGYVVAVGAALVASELIRRRTQDLDLFTSAPVVSIFAAKESFLKAISRRRWTVTVIHDSPTLCRLVVIDRDDEVLVDLAVDSPPHLPATTTLLGPTLAPLELAGRKLLALLGRAEARDFADVCVLAERFGEDALLIEARVADPGFDKHVLAQMMTTLDRFFRRRNPGSAEIVPEIRLFFARWAGELSRAFQAVHEMPVHIFRNGQRWSVREPRRPRRDRCPGPACRRSRQSGVGLARSSHRRRAISCVRS